MSSPSVGMSPCVALPMDPDTLHDVVEKAKDYALMHGEIKELQRNCEKSCRF